MNRRGVRLGRVLGVEIFLHPSWFLLAGLIAFVLGQGFSTGSPGFSGAGSVVLGLMGAVLFFASLLAHELAHSVVAQRKGIPVHRITLFLLGGAAQITREPDTAGDEAKIALAGPALSVVLGVLLLGLGLVADQVGALAGAALFGTLGAINLLLAAFNMLPGFPMDGGRVLRAAIWAGTHDLAKATRMSTGASGRCGTGRSRLSGPQGGSRASSRSRAWRQSPGSAGPCSRPATPWCRWRWKWWRVPPSPTTGWPPGWERIPPGASWS